MLKYILALLFGILCFGAGVLVQWKQEENDVRVLKEKNARDMEEVVQQRDKAVRQEDLEIKEARADRKEYQDAITFRNRPPPKFSAAFHSKKTPLAELAPLENTEDPHLSIWIQRDDGEVVHRFVVNRLWFHEDYVTLLIE
jgi:hypothetical protein